MNQRIILVFLTGRRFNYFTKTINSLLNHNPDIKDVVDKVWLLDDRSSLEERQLMENILRENFCDRYNVIYFNSEKKFDFVEKFNFIKKITEKNDIIFLMEDDWECFDRINIFEVLNFMNQTSVTQVSFADPLWIQTDEIKNINDNDSKFWKNPYPNHFRHPFRWKDGFYYWDIAKINNYTNNPSFVKADIFHNNNFEYNKNFEALFANVANGNHYFTKQDSFRHIGENSLITSISD